MVKNCGKGGKSHKAKKKSGYVDNSRELIFKDGNDQDYAVVTDLLGNNRCRLILDNDKSTCMGIICGKMRKKQIYTISKESLVLVSLRDFQTDKVDIIHVYQDDEIKILENYNEITLCNSEKLVNNYENIEFDYEQI